MKQWNRSQFDTTSAASIRSVTGEVVVEPGSFHFTLNYEGTTDELQLDALQERILITYLLFTQVPDEGLDELIDTISDIAEFYRLVHKNQAPSLPKTPPLSVNITEPSVRPEFPIVPDEV